MVSTTLFRTVSSPKRDGSTVLGCFIGDMQKKLRNSAHDSLRHVEREKVKELFASRVGLINQLGDDVAGELWRLDALYRNFVARRQAGSYVKAEERGGIYTAQHDVRGIEACRPQRRHQGIGIRADSACSLLDEFQYEVGPHVSEPRLPDMLVQIPQLRRRRSRIPQ